jgi:hypothetical protein
MVFEKRRKAMKDKKKYRLGIIMVLGGIVLAIPLPLILLIKIIMFTIALINNNSLNSNLWYPALVVGSFVVGVFLIAFGIPIKD